MATLQSVVFLPLSAQTADAETIAWCRGVPLAIAEELQRLGMARATFAGWTTGRGLGLKLAHLQSAPPVGHVAAYARAARARLGISGWGSWHGDPFLRWEVVDADGDEARRVPVDTHPGASRLEVVRMAWETSKLVLGLRDDRPSPVLEGTESDAALLAWLQDRQQIWYRHRRGQDGPWDGEYRFLVSALTHDPAFEVASRALIRRVGRAISPSDEPTAVAARTRAAEALQALLRVRADDHLCWTLLGLLHRASRQPEQATTALRRAASLDPEYAPAHRELGLLFLQQRDLRAAGAHLRRAGRIAPQDPEVQFALGSLYIELKDRNRAAQHLRVVLRLAPGTELAKAAARLLRDLDEGPVRRPTDALVADARDDREARRARDRELIARTFGLPALEGAPDEDVTSPGDDFLDRLDDEATHWDPDDTVWSD